MTTSTLSARAKTEAADAWLSLVAEQVRQLRFGVVQIVVHDSRVVQIERTEKVRLTPSNSEATQSLK
jgi:hypothetical protein